MSPTKKAGGAKKGGTKKAGAKKGAAKKSASKKSSAASKKAMPGLGKCGGWKAVHDFMPPGTPTLRVTGKCVFPVKGFKVRLVKAVPQGINPNILLLRKIVTPPFGIPIPGVTTVPVKFSLKTSHKYTHVTILPDGVTVKVQIVA